MPSARDAKGWAAAGGLHGIGDSLYTPFSGADGDDIDYDAYRALVRYCVGDLGHEMLWLTSGIAEWWSLTMDERKKLVEYAIEEARGVNPDVVIQACTSATSAKDCVELTQHAQAAGQSAEQANGAAQEAVNRVDTLQGVIANLDQYKPISDISVTFGFDKSVLTKADKEQLDQLADSLQNARGYILAVTGGTDSVGDAQYNYGLSNRRADAVVNYLQTKYNIPPHKFYLIGIGKDDPAADNKTAAGRAKNRRVEVKLMSNMNQGTNGSSTTTGSTQPAGRPGASSGGE